VSSCLRRVVLVGCGTGLSASIGRGRGGASRMPASSGEAPARGIRTAATGTRSLTIVAGDTSDDCCFDGQLRRAKMLRRATERGKREPRAGRRKIVHSKGGESGAAGRERHFADWGPQPRHLSEFSVPWGLSSAAALPTVVPRSKLLGVLASTVETLVTA
jgi:hypothetical protein